MNIEAAIAELQEGRPADVAYVPDLRRGVFSVVHSWKKFCALPKETKQRFVYTEDVGATDGAGYELKEVPGERRDLKENFHVTLRERERLARLTQEIGAPEATWFIHEADTLIDLATPMIQEFAGVLGKTLSLPNLASEVMAGQKSWIFRYIHYFGGRTVGDQIAVPHPDKCGFTLHLFEDNPGLEYLDIQKQWQPMPVSYAQTAIIPGMQLQFACQNRLKAICHRVLATGKSATEGRYSIVCFVPLVKTKGFNTKVAGRQQDLPPGYNYDLPYAELQDLFV